jgi:predicted naringenin-chalcone synthase
MMEIPIKATAEFVGRHPSIQTALSLPWQLLNHCRGARRSLRARPGNTAATASNMPLLLDLATRQKYESISKTIHRAVLLNSSLKMSELIFIKPRTVLKTSSGKVRRRQNVNNLLDGKMFDAVLWCQSVRPSVSYGVRAWDPAVYQDPSGVRAPAVSQPKQSETKVGPRVVSPEARRKVEEQLLSILTAETKLTKAELRAQLVASGGSLGEAKASLEALGLDSISLIRISERITQSCQLPVKLSPFMLISDPSLNGLVNVILKLQTSKPVEKTLAVKQAFGDAKSKSVPWDPPLILALASQVPGPGMRQKEIINKQLKHLQLPEAKENFFKRVGAGSKISRRYSIFKSVDAIYFGKAGLNGEGESIEARNDIYKAEGPKLATKTAALCIKNWGMDKMGITHVVGVSCTGVVIPGIEFHVMSNLGLAANTQRLSIGFMGCFGAVSGMKMAKAIARESPTHRVLVICLEICSLHMQLNDNSDNLIGSAIFADGCGAMIVGCEKREGETPLYELHHSASHIIGGTLDMMAWELSNTGMQIGLSREIPSQIYQHIPMFMSTLLDCPPLAGKQIKPKDMKWAIHPGGRLIIEAICDAVGIESEDCAASWSVLKNYGNMSSATLIFVLEEMRKRRDLGDAWIPALAFGPGLNVEGALLRACN